MRGYLLLLILFIGFYLFVTWKIQCRYNRLLNVQNQIDIMNTGSTYGYYDFDYSNLKVKGGNLANVPQYLDYDFILLKKYIHKVKIGGKVLIVLPYFVFAGGNTNDDKKVYYEALYPWEMKQFKIKRLLRFIWKAAKEPFTNTYKKEQDKWKGHVASFSEKEEHAKKRIHDWEKTLKIPDVKSDEITEELLKRIEDNKKIVLSMISLCIREKREPVLLIPPTSEIMQKLVSKRCLKRYLRDPIEEIIQKTGIQCLDYMDQDEFGSVDLYLNSDCLNEKGRKLFTASVVEKLYEI